jgi:hypothetical protein
MARRQLSTIVLLGAFLSLGATHRTPNFTVEAATPQIAQQVGQYAEHYRREKALLWLGYEMPPWPEPCPLRVKVTMGGSGGATSFAFDRGQVLGQHMQIEGTLERLLASVLPHEVTHTVFAHHFRQPVPRWADEGGSVLSEDEVERKRHDNLVRHMINNRRAMPLRRLFALKEYPPDVMVLYAQGYSVTDFLVGRSSRPKFLNFVADGLRAGWDRAAQALWLRERGCVGAGVDSAPARRRAASAGRGRPRRREMACSGGGQAGGADERSDGNGARRAARAGRSWGDAVSG